METEDESNYLTITVTDKDSPSLKKLLHSLYEKGGAAYIYVDFSATELMRKLGRICSSMPFWVTTKSGHFSFNRC